jgi:hypothetical protein
MNTMNRCLKLFFSSMLLATASLPVLAPLPAQAQGTPRTFPESALRGKLVVTLPPHVTLNGKPDRLSPGARIHDTGNAADVGRTGQPGTDRELRARRHEQESLHQDLRLPDERVRLGQDGRRDARRRGLRAHQDVDEADLILFNTCSVREKAQEKVFSDLGRVST